MNPYALLAGCLVAVALWFGGDHFGYVRGGNAQKVADQAQFDKTAKAIENQKRDAAALLGQINAENMALMVERERFKADLEKQREENRRATDGRRDRYADVGLRFVAGKGTTGSGDRCPESGSSDRTPAGSSAAETVELPRPLATNLRWLVYEADKLNDDYRKCLNYVNRNKP